MTLNFEHTILLVDDEQSITKSLQRLFRKERYNILTASGGQEALDMLAGLDKLVSLIISDQRMPGMTGAVFLEKAKALAPDAVRFLLTGYSEIKDVLDAVNKGEIHRYLTKPWNDEELLIQVRRSLERFEIESENRRLVELTARQNQELSELNHGLEKKIEERTLELLQKSKALEEANESLARGFVDTIRLLFSLVETINPKLGSYLSFVGQLARRIAQEFGMDQQELDQIEIAGILHDIGLLGIPRRVFEKEEQDMVEAELILFKQHPIIGQICLQPVEKLEVAGNIIFCHHENYDGTGFPSGLLADQIPLGSRIIHVAADYAGMLRRWPESIPEIRQKSIKYLGHSARQINTQNPKKLIQEIIKQILIKRSFREYDPEVVKKLVKIQEADSSEKDNSVSKSISVSLKYLKPGMTTAKDLRTSDGRLLLARGITLKPELIAAIRKLAETSLVDYRVDIVVQ